jgi:hypothetical protein
MPIDRIDTDKADVFAAKIGKLVQEYTGDENSDYCLIITSPNQRGFAWITQMCIVCVRDFISRMIEGEGIEHIAEDNINDDNEDENKIVH